VEEAMRNANSQKMWKWEAEVQRRADEEARAAEFEAKAEDATCKAEAAEREAEAARVVVLEAVSGLEKVVASEVVREALTTAYNAKNEADTASRLAATAARKADCLWV